MIKFLAGNPAGRRVFGFGLSEANLNRMQFNNEPLFFDFGYAGNPELFGLILYVGDFDTPEQIHANLEQVKQRALPAFNLGRGVSPESLRMFVLSRDIVEKFRQIPFWGFNTALEITHPEDQQLFFSGRTEQDIEAYLIKEGLITPDTERTTKGFKGFGRPR